MKFIHLLAAVGCAVGLVGCGGEKQEHSDLFDYSDPVDLSAIGQTYDWYQHYEGEDKDSILFAKLGIEQPQEGSFLITDTAFVLRVPEYANSEQLFLAKAEDYYNGCAVFWNIRSNYEVWLRGHTSDMLQPDDDVKRSIESIDINIFKDEELRQAAQELKDSIVMLLDTDPYEWAEGFPVEKYFSPFANVVVSKAYLLNHDEEACAVVKDSVMKIAEGLAMDKFEHYMAADEDGQLRVMLGELSSCQNFDEQCSLWRNWANCNKSSGEDEWIVAVGSALMKSGKYNLNLHNIWVSWRAINQSAFYGSSRSSYIPNQYYNEYRKMCYYTCLKHVESHPADTIAIEWSNSIGGRPNMNRFGENYFGNEALVECFEMLPNRYNSEEGSDEK